MPRPFELLVARELRDLGAGKLKERSLRRFLRARWIAALSAVDPCPVTADVLRDDVERLDRLRELQLQFRASSLDRVVDPRLLDPRGT